MVPRRDIPPRLIGAPFLLSEAVAAGISRKVVRGRRFRRMLRGVYVWRDAAETEMLRFDAVRLLLPMAAASHLTAARLRRLPVPDTDPRLHITVPPPAERPRITGVRGHVGPLGQDLRTVHRRPLLSVERTLCDLAAARPPLGLVDLVIFGVATNSDDACSAIWAGRSSSAPRPTSSSHRTGRFAGCTSACSRRVTLACRERSPTSGASTGGDRR